MMKLIMMIFSFFIFSQGALAELLFTESRFEPRKKWYKTQTDEKSGIKNLLKKLVRSPAGKKLVMAAKDKATQQGDELLSILKAGNGSLTDTTLSRKFSINDPEDIEFESRSVVYINKDLSQYDALLDLAHELTHFVYRKPFNPYKMNFTLAEFIKSTVEGEGGEAKAFLTECLIQKELFSFKVVAARANCRKVMDEQTASFSFPKAISHFYQVGNHYKKFQKTLSKYKIKGDLPLVNDNKASFISSAYGIPYPVAAFEEYLSVLNKVCENDRKRIGYMKMKAKKGRFPASVLKIESDFNKKCSTLFE